MTEWTMKKFLEENDQKFLDEIEKLRSTIETQKEIIKILSDTVAKFEEKFGKQQ